jgi:hypothetical protein
MVTGQRGVRLEIELASWFRLPRMGREYFAKLMRAGVEYKEGQFRIGEGADLNRVEAILSEALGETIFYSVPCAVCGRPAGCPRCRYQSWCDRRVVSRRCICESCAGEEARYQRYMAAFRRRAYSGD